MNMDEIDRRLVVATQGGLPLTPHPYHDVAVLLGIAPDEVMQRMLRMQENGSIRRIGVVPNHYALGYHANGMTVWDVADARMTELGAMVGALPFVSHCYRRPRHLPDWPYNLFAMVHGRDRSEVSDKAAQIAALLGDACRQHEILYSSKILKKSGLRFGG
jgi:siroheme decarboxylase